MMTSFLPLLLFSFTYAQAGVILAEACLQHSRFIRASKGEAKVHSLKIESRISSRFASTHVTSLVENVNSEEAQDLTFTAQLPSDAFISNFTMTRGSELLVAEVKGKAEAQSDFDSAKAAGRTTGLVKQKPRETNIFETTVSIKPGEKVLFNMTYQEILKRVHNFYKHTINIIDTKGIDDVSIDVWISERGEITGLHVPEFAPNVGELTNKELLQRPANPSVKIERSQNEEGYTTVHTSFTPKSGDAGQLAVLYDVRRENVGGEVEVVDGFFVHFFAPPADFIDDMSARIVFVLDRSGSMSGRKFDQLQAAMQTIIVQLKEEDQFSIVWFSSDVKSWSPTLKPANEDNKEEALEFVKESFASGGTNIHGALLEGLTILDQNGEVPSSATNMVLFLTDGLPSAGDITDIEGIKEAVKASLAFGDDADYDSMKDIARESRGLARKIYQASDAALQLDGFYNEVALPIFSDVEFKYLDDTVRVDSIRKSRADGTLYDGSEMVIFGKMKDPASKILKGTVVGESPLGRMAFPAGSACFSCCQHRCPRACGVARCISIPEFNDDIVEVTPKKLPANSLGGFVERMWAYMTIKKNLEDAEVNPDAADAARLRREAKTLALQYNFVTSETSLVIADAVPSLKPAEDADEAESQAGRPRPPGASGFSFGRGMTSSFGPGAPAKRVRMSRGRGRRGRGGGGGSGSGAPGGVSFRGPVRTRSKAKSRRVSSSRTSGFAASITSGSPGGMSKTAPLPPPSPIMVARPSPTADLADIEEEEDEDKEEESLAMPDEAAGEEKPDCTMTVLMMVDKRGSGAAKRARLQAQLQAGLGARPRTEVRVTVLDSAGLVPAADSGAFFAKGEGALVVVVLAGPEAPHSSFKRAVFPALKRRGARTLVAHSGTIPKYFFATLDPTFLEDLSAQQVLAQITC